MHEMSVPTIPMSAMAIVFRSSRGKSMSCQTSAKFCHAGASVHARSSVRHDPSQVIGGAAGFAGSMKSLCWRPGLSSASVRFVPSIGTT